MKHLITAATIAVLILKQSGQERVECNFAAFHSTVTVVWGGGVFHGYKSLAPGSYVFWRDGRVEEGQLIGGCPQ